MEKITIDLAKSILKSLNKSRNHSNSLHNLMAELKSDLYPMQMVIKELEKRDLLNVINASNKTNPNDLLILLSPKAEYYKNNFDSIFEIETENIKNRVLKKITFLKQKRLMGGLSLDQDFEAKEKLEELEIKLEKLKEV